MNSLTSHVMRGTQVACLILLHYLHYSSSHIACVQSPFSLGLALPNHTVHNQLLKYSWHGRLQGKAASVSLVISYPRNCASAMLCLSFITVSLTASFFVVSHLLACSIPSIVIKGVTEFTSPCYAGSGVRKEGRQCSTHPVHLRKMVCVHDLRLVQQL